VEHWLFPRLGLVRYWNLYRGRKVNPAALAAWLVSAAFVVVALRFGWMHPFFLFLPTFFIAALAYVLLAWICGAGKPIPDDVRRDVDAVEARIAELAEQDADKRHCPHGTERQLEDKPSPRRRLPIFGILAAAMLAMLAWGAMRAPHRFKRAAVVYTALYFAFAAAATVAGQKTE